jgi:diguanylate cyclase (GGDEF)-like protein/hemerythrin-like metal-binding protein/PAS domain S-box-containing protein
MINRKSTILIIDDTPVNLLTLGIALEEDFELQIAISGERGLALALQAPPDLILLDIMMPEMDGFEVCRKLKSNPVLKDIPVVFVSALSEIESESKGLRLGAVDYISKPVNVEIARQRIYNLIDREILRKSAVKQQQQLEISEAFKHAVLNSLPEEIVVLDQNGNIQEANNPWYRFAQNNPLESGKLPSYINVGSNYLDVCRKAIAEGASEAVSAYEALGGIQEVLNGTLPAFSMEYPCHSPAEQRWFRMVVAPLQLSMSGGVVISHIDISDSKVIQAKLVESEAHLRAIVQNEPECIKVVDAQGLLVQMNPAGLAMIEADSLGQVSGHPILSLIAPEYQTAFLDMHKRVLSGEHLQMEFEEIGLKGGRRWLETHAVPMQEHGQTVHLAVTRDITQRKSMEDQVRQLAFHDPLTGLPNRRLLNDRLDHLLATTRRSGSYSALMFLDLDNFKPLNDSYGHKVGDLLLVEVGRRISSCIRAIDTVARFGGDEFVILINELNADANKSKNHATTVAEKVRVSLSATYELTSNDGEISGSVEHHCTASIGVIVFNGDANKDELLKCADMSMYEAKSAGRNFAVVKLLGAGASVAVSDSVDRSHDILRLIWQSYYCCGEPTIDSAHRKLFDLANSLIDAEFSRSQRPSQFDANLQALLAHVVQHFAEEESILASHNYEDLEAHAQAHRKLLEQALQLRDRAMQGGVDFGELVEFLANDVIAQHLLKTDRKFFPLFAASKPAGI